MNWSELVELVDRSGYNSLWVGDHISFAVPILDPLLQLAQAAVVSRRLMLGTSVYLLPLRHAGAGGQAGRDAGPSDRRATDLRGRRRRRVPQRIRVCGVPRDERGARLTEGIAVAAPVLVRRAGHPRRHAITAPSPTCRCSRRRASAAVRRSGAPAARKARIAPHRTPGRWLAVLCRDPRDVRASLAKIDAAAQEAGRDRSTRFGTGHLLFTRLDDSYETALDAADRDAQRPLRDGFP